MICTCVQSDTQSDGNIADTYDGDDGAGGSHDSDKKDVIFRYHFLI